jgi:HD-like signal output (HDOD) protein
VSRVLFVDRSLATLDALRDAFRSQQALWDMEFVSDPSAAVAAMTATSADVVIGDAEVLRQVRQRFPDAARVLLAEHHASDDLAATISLAHQFVSKPWEADELCDAIRRALRLRDQVTAMGGVRTDISEIDMLPTPSPVFTRLLTAIADPNGSARAIADIVSHDVGLTAKVIQLVNSSFFAPRTRVTSVEAAVVRLGSSVIRTLALIDEVNRDIHDPTGVKAWVADLGNHTYAVAELARRLAPREFADDAFCGGLLHECGQLVFARCRPDVFGAHLQQRREANRSLAELEREAFGVTHAYAGAYLLNLWGCPIDVIDSVTHHDSNELSRNERVQVVQVAHRLVEHIGPSFCGAPELDADDLAWLDDSYFADEARAWLATTLEDGHVPAGGVGGTDEEHGFAAVAVV